MSDQNDQSDPAADPPSDHETPGANPVNEQQDQTAVSEPTTEVQTPAGTTVTEQAPQDAQDDQSS